MRKNRGIGFLVAAAFIGPGTITTCMMAGFQHGYELVWALATSILITIVLQEMALRVGMVTGRGIVANLKSIQMPKSAKLVVMGLVALAIFVGNTAYQAGNISGAVLGMSELVSDSFYVFLPFLVGISAFLLLWTGSHQRLQNLFTILIGLMGLCFVGSALLLEVQWSLVLQSFFKVSIKEDSLPRLLALVGTTVVPYNLFLQAGMSAQGTHTSSLDLRQARQDNFIALMIGGIISLSIIVLGAAIELPELQTATDLSAAIQPIFHSFAPYVMGFGLFLAGLTSAITAPLAAALVAREMFGWEHSFKDYRFKGVWIGVLFFGVLALSLQMGLLEIIQIAQIANSIILPVVASLLLWMVNQKELLPNAKNSVFQNLFGLLAIVFTLFLGIKGLIMVLG